MLSGTFQVAGGLGDHLLYANDAPDGNGNNWFFYFDNDSKIWKYSYGGIPSPGDDVLGQIVSEYDSTLTGQFNFLENSFDQFKFLSQQ